MSRTLAEELIASLVGAGVQRIYGQNVLAMPPKATIKQAAGFALSMTKMAFSGQIDGVLDTVAPTGRN